MKLNADVVFENLQELFSTEISGPCTAALCLETPKFYEASSEEFTSNHLYVVKGEWLPRKATIGKNVVIVCVGESVSLHYYRERCCVIQIKQEADLFLVFNVVQETFDRYALWDSALNRILVTSANIKEMVDCSQSIFENPIFVIDSNFQFLAHSGYGEVAITEWEEALAQQTDGEGLDLSIIGSFIKTNEMVFDKKGPLHFNMLDNSVISFNLFENEEYIGCLSIDYRLRKHRNSDDALGQYLAQLIEHSMRKQPLNLSNQKNAVKQMVQCLLDGIPLNPHLQTRLERAYSKQELICVLLEYIHNVPKVPISYVCNTVESTFPKSIAFEYKGAVIGLISAEIFQKDTGEQSNEMQERTMAVILSLGLRAGISDAFKEIVKVNIYYLQASAALANGAVLNPSKEYHEFSSYALNEMMINLSGQLPLEMYYSEGLRRLVEHDAVAKVSYLETLRIYLEENMGVQKAAQRLYIHRSTFLERFARIEKILDTNLKDPNERLRLQILLKAIQARDEILGGVK